MKSFKVKCLQDCRGLVYLLYISPTKRLTFLFMRTGQKKKVDNFQRNTCGSHFVFQNDANFSPREAYPPMKISCKFGEASGIVNAKPKYPQDASSEYKYTDTHNEAFLYFISALAKCKSKISGK